LYKLPPFGSARFLLAAQRGKAFHSVICESFANQEPHAAQDDQRRTYYEGSQFRPTSNKVGEKVDAQSPQQIQAAGSTDS
jgi:hypothetical protein